MSRRFSVLAKVSGFMLSVIVLSACQPPDDAQEVDVREDVSVNDETEAGDSTTLNYAVPSLTDNLDFSVAGQMGLPWRYAGYNFGSTLFSYDVSKLENDGCAAFPEPQAVSGELADSWEFDEDRNIYTITLRDDIVSAYGNPLTTEDVAWSFERHFATDRSAVIDYQAIADYPDAPVTILDDYTFEMQVNSPTTLDLGIHATWPGHAIMDSTKMAEHATDDDPWAEEWAQDNWAGFGPWLVEDFIPGERLVLESNKNYYGERGNIQRVIYTAVPEASSRLQLIKQGEVDLITGLNFDQFQSLQGVDGINIENCVGPRRDLITFNQKDGPFADPNVRRAVSLAIDRQALVDGPYRGFAQPAIRGLHEGMPYPAEDPELLYDKYDPDAAMELLAEAGYEGGLDEPVELIINAARPGAHAEDVAVFLQGQLNQIGIKLVIQPIASSADFLGRWGEGRFEAALYMEQPLIAEPGTTLTLHHLCESAIQNVTGYCNPDFDEAAQAVNSLLPGEERDEATRVAAEIILRDNPFNYLVDRQCQISARSDIKGYRHYPHCEVMVHHLDM